MTNDTIQTPRCFLALCLWLVSGFLAAQTPPVHSNQALSYQCGADAASHYLWQNNPHLQQLNTLIDRELFEHISSRNAKQPRTLSSDEVYTIPVVVHIVHNGGKENIADSQVLEGIRHINEALSALRIGNSSTMSIALCLARQDDNTMPTGGITRMQSPLTDMTIETDDLALKNLNRWNPAKYLNIWLVRSVSSASAGSAVAGYAYMPFAHGSPEDGIVVEARYFGSSAENSAAAIHELGHYLGLYHTFQGGCGNNNCLLDGDHVCDTPPDASTAHTACDAQVNSCTSDSDDHSANNPFRSVAEGGIGDQKDMATNIMDYGNLACLRVFTPGQAVRIRTTLLGVRSSLLSSPGCQDPCTAKVNTSFTANLHSVLAGATVKFTNTSTGMSIYSWRINNVEFATTEHASHTFTAPGTYSISLEASNGDPRCMRLAYDTVVVTCGARAKLTASSVYIEPGQRVDFTNASSGAHTFVWIVDGKQRSTSTSYSEIFTTAGGHLVLLIASNGLCADTAYAFVNVGSCGGRQSSIWYFGNQSGLDFSTEPPTVLSDGAIDTREGCATMCNNEGQLLFYTDGVSVWDRLHRVMPGGDKTLGGHSSSSQSALIIPYPGSRELYYIFTTDAAEALYESGLSYAVVDMSRNNGVGEVTKVERRIRDNVAEKLTAVLHNNKRDFWIVVRGLGNQFYSYLFSEAGIASQPVVSVVDNVYGFEHGAGVMKISPAGNRIVLANFKEGALEVYPFDKSSGEISQQGSYVLDNIKEPYGIEFSPNGQYLYSSQSFTPNGLYQYNLSAGSAAAVQASAFFISSGSTHKMGALQLAPNGKIYVASYNSPGLAAINAPNQPKAGCDYRSTVLTLPHTARFGLPSSINLPSQHQQGKIAGSTSVCIATTASYTLVGLNSNAAAPRWEHNGKAALSFSGDNHTAYLHFTASGSDTLIAMYEGRCSIVEDTLVITSSAPPVVSLGPDTSGCDKWPITLDPGPGFAAYRWQNGSTSRTFSVSTPGVYWVAVSTALGCTAADTIVVGSAISAAPNLGPDISTCSGVYVLDAGAGFRRYRWQDGSSDRRFTVYAPGTYRVEVETLCGLVLYDTVVVSQAPGTMQTAGDTTICLGGSAQLFAGGTTGPVLWSPSLGLSDSTSTTPIASPEQTTTYTVRGTNAEGCIVEGNVTVVVEHLPLQVRGDTTICLGGSAQLAAIGTTAPVLWIPSDGLDNPTSTTPIASPETTTTYIARSLHSNGCMMEGRVTIVVEHINLQVSGDTTICLRGSARLSASGTTAPVLWTPSDGLDNPTSPTPTASPEQTTIYTVRSTNTEGCVMEGTVTVTVRRLALQILGDTTVCMGGSVQLIVPEDIISVQWTPSDGLDNPSSRTPTASPQETTTYTAHGMTHDGCEMEGTVTIVLRQALLQTSSDTTICPGASAQLSVQGDVISVQWTPPDGLDNPFSPTPIASPQHTTTYTAHATTPEGCTVEGTVTVNVISQNQFVLRLPDTTAVPGSHMSIPLYLEVPADILPLSIPALHLAVRYRSSLLKTDGLTIGKASIAPDIDDGNYETISIELQDVVLTKSRSTITSITGTAFLGDSTSTALTIEHAQSGECLAPISLAGSLTPADVCNLSSRLIRLRDMTAPILAVAPNPASDAATAEVATSEEGPHTLSVYNLQGQLLWQGRFVHSGTRSAHLLPIGLHDIPAGLYQAVLTTPSQATTTTLSVIK